MGGIPNTMRRGGVYHFRRAVPDSLRGLLDRSELTCSLHTHDAGAARMLSRCLYLRSEELFGIVMSTTTLNDADVAALVKDFYETILKKDGDDRLMSDVPDTDQMREARAEHYRILAERARIDLASNAFGSVRWITEAALARRYGMDASFDTLSVRKVKQAMLRAGVDVAEALRARAEGDFNYAPRDKLLAAALLQADAPVVASPTPADAPTCAPKALFLAEAEAFREAQLRRKVWEQQTGLQARKTYALFAEHFGDCPIASFTRPDAAAFKALLEDLPASYGKAAEFRGMRASEIVAATKDRIIERLSSRTVQRHFATLSAFLGAAVQISLADGNSQQPSALAINASCGRATTCVCCSRRPYGRDANRGIAARSPAI